MTTRSDKSIVECHFSWRLQDGATRTLEDVKRRSLERLSVDPLNKVGYYALLAYVYSQPSTADIKEAERCLTLADEVCQQVQSGQLSSHYLIDKFVIDANRLFIQRERKQNLNELPMRLEELQIQWKTLDDQSKGSVFAIKGLALLRFGLTKYEEAIEAYAEANRLTERSNFLFLFGELELKARLRRSRNLTGPADRNEASLWIETHKLSLQAPNEFLRPYFLVVYAESIVNNAAVELCKSLTDQAWMLLSKLPHSEKIKNHEAILKCAKCYRALKSRCKKIKDVELAVEINSTICKALDEINDCLLGMKDEIPTAGALFHISNELFDAGNHIGCRTLLEQAQKVANKPGHLHVDLQLVLLKRLTRKKLNETYATGDCLADYDSLILKYKSCTGDVALIMLHKAEYQIRCRKFADAFQTMVEADALDCTCWNQIRRTKLCYMYRIIGCELDATGREFCKREHYVWYLQRVQPLIDDILLEDGNHNVQALYEAILLEEPRNDFVLQHLGELYVSKGFQNDAEMCFRMLHRINPSICSKKLLALSLLQTNCKQCLVECSNLGCADACEKLLHVLIHQKDGKKSRLDSNWLRQQIERYSEGKPRNELLSHFSRESYEICAIIHNLFVSDFRFYINKPNDEKIHRDAVTSMIDRFLEIEYSESGSGNRDNAMRKSRFQATKRQLLQTIETMPQDVVDLDADIARTLKEAKESLDRSTKVLPPETFPDYFVHGFNELRKKELGKDPEHCRQRKGLATDDGKKLDEDNLVQLLLSRRQLASRDSIAECTRAELKRAQCLSFASDERTKSIFEFLVTRESALLTEEGPWLVRWIYGVNREKHSQMLDIGKLSEQLMQHGLGPKSAYEMSHRAAEFTEEAKVVMLSWRADTEAHDDTVASDDNKLKVEASDDAAADADEVASGSSTGKFYFGPLFD